MIDMNKIIECVSSFWKRRGATESEEFTITSGLSILFKNLTFQTYSISIMV